MFVCDIVLMSMFYGWISVDFVLLSYIRVWFDGVIKDVKVNIGDFVKKGDILVVVEFNESLKSYFIMLFFDGNVIVWYVNNGELLNG